MSYQFQPEYKEKLDHNHEANLFDSLPETNNRFYSDILAISIKALKMNTFLDNFDLERFPDNKELASTFDPMESAKYFNWFFHHHSDLFETFNLFSDQKSKLLFLHLIAYRLAGHICVRIPLHFSEESACYQKYSSLVKKAPSALTLQGFKGGLYHFDFELNNKRYLVDTLDLKHVLYRQQYFFSRDMVKIMPEPGDYVIDGGAFLGDTAVTFANSVSPNGKVYSFDPVRDHLDILKHNVDQNPNLNIQIMPYGLSNTDVDCPPIKIDRYHGGFTACNKKVPVRAIDSLVSKNEIERLDYIKLDIEGSELDAIKGAIKSIGKFKPKLAISLYHKPQDFFEIPSFISKNFPFYKFYLRHYTCHKEETVLYCDPF